MIAYAARAERLLGRKTTDVGSDTYLEPKSKRSSLTQNFRFSILLVPYLYLRGSRGGTGGGLCFAKRHLDQQFSRGFLDHAFHGHTLCGLPHLPTTFRQARYAKQLSCTTNSQKESTSIFKSTNTFGLSTFGSATASAWWFHHLLLFWRTLLTAGRTSTSSDREVKIIGVSGCVTHLLEVCNQFHFGTECLSLWAEQETRDISQLWSPGNFDGHIPLSHRRFDVSFIALSD